MQTVKINKDIEFEEKILLCLYWTARKASRTEGCAPLYIKKIVTPNNRYVQSSPKLLKLSPKLVSDIQDDIGDFEHLEVEIDFGGEILNANFRDENFSISTSKDKVLEIEIADTINEQFKKKCPRTCPQFLSKVYKN